MRVPPDLRAPWRRPRRRPRRLAGTLALAAAGALGALALAAGPARADANVARQAMRVQLLSPAVSADGKSIAIASLDPGGEAGASGSLAIFDAAGVLKRRLPLFTPARDPERARRAYAKATRLLDEGGYRRMARLRRNSERTHLRRAPADPPPTFEGFFSQGDYGFAVHVARGQVRVEARKGSRKLGTYTRRLGPAPRCRRVAGYSVSPTRAGFETSGRVLAFSVYAETTGGEACFSYDYVVATK
jgi:hypothetical protein